MVHFQNEVIRLAETYLGIENANSLQNYFDSPHPDENFFYSFLDGHIVSFIHASIVEFDNRPAVLIQSAVSLPGHESQSREIFHALELWTRERGLNDIFAIIERPPKGFIRKYGFKFYGTIIQKSIS